MYIINFIKLVLFIVTKLISYQNNARHASCVPSLRCNNSMLLIIIVLFFFFAYIENHKNNKRKAAANYNNGTHVITMCVYVCVCHIWQRSARRYLSGKTITTTTTAATSTVNGCECILKCAPRRFCLFECVKNAQAQKHTHTHTLNCAVCLCIFYYVSAYLLDTALGICELVSSRKSSARATVKHAEDIISAQLKP